MSSNRVSLSQERFGMRYAPGFPPKPLVIIDQEIQTMASYKIRRRVLPVTFKALALLCLVAISPAFATTTCVSDSTQLTVALTVGQLQTQPYTIKIVQGTYLLGTDFNLNLSAATTIEGGYTANCASRTVNSANTTLDMQGHELALFQGRGAPFALIDFDGLTISNSREPLNKPSISSSLDLS
jgi:hypothetical protein